MYMYMYLYLDQFDCREHIPMVNLYATWLPNSVEHYVSPITSLSIFKLSPGQSRRCMANYCCRTARESHYVTIYI